MNLKPKYFIRPERCLLCQRCMAVCPAGAIELCETGSLNILTSKCNRCGACKKFCKQRAISSRIQLWS